MLKKIELSKEEYTTVTFVIDEVYKTLYPIPFLLLHPFDLFDKNVILLEKLKDKTKYVVEGGFPNKSEERILFLTEVTQSVTLFKYALRIILQMLLQIIFAVVIVVSVVFL
jgi:hypothetical protein